MNEVFRANLVLIKSISFTIIHKTCFTIWRKSHLQLTSELLHLEVAIIILLPGYYCVCAKFERGFYGGVTGFLGSLKISPCEERRLKDIQNLKCEDRRFQNCIVLKTEDLVTKPED